ncbi:MAG: hypothetical protein QNJ44_13230 [Rhodobacter sp.]|nr:hypothetical protein [Rhodobacter sp.]
MATSKDKIQYRSDFKMRLLENPNFFGTLSKMGVQEIQPPVFELIGDTHYEELTCIGFNPLNDLLSATVKIKQQSGYSGGPCSPGSFEYVRFYVDYGDGTWVDSGVGSFNVHDFGMPEDFVYAVKVALDPVKRAFCYKDAVLPKVRAILSWDDIPPENQPDWPPVWGNVLEADIQLEPLPNLELLFEGFQIGIPEKIDPVMIEKVKAAAKPFPLPPKKALSLSKQLKAIDRSDQKTALRALMPKMQKLAAKPSSFDATNEAKKFKSLGFDIGEMTDQYVGLASDMTYEQLHCVGLDRAARELYGIVQVKKPYGFSGGLCDKGSKEYVAFYVDFGSGWEYQGTSEVEVHDISPLPAGGLWYQVSHPVDLDGHRQEWCNTGKARVRAILSWNTKPTPGDETYNPKFGNWLESWIEVEPLPEGAPVGELGITLHSIGNIPKGNIEPTGYADGWNNDGTFKADQSPFGGQIVIKVDVTSAPGPLEYQILLTEPSGSGQQVYSSSFHQIVRQTDGTSQPETQVASPDGWFTHLPTASTKILESPMLVARLTGQKNGLHTVQVRFRHAVTKADLGQTIEKPFVVDNTRPEVMLAITSGAGNCGKFTIGDKIEGTFEMLDMHFNSVSLRVEPNAEAKGGTISMYLGAVSPANLIAEDTSASSTVVSFDVDDHDPGYGNPVSGTWQLDTTGMLPCGFTVEIHGRDRTIVNSENDHWWRRTSVGFCLEEPES